MMLGGTIRSLRMAAGFSQKEFAASLDISAAYLSLLESDKREATIPLLRRMAKQLGSPSAILFAAAIASKLPVEERQDEIEVIRRLIDAVRLNLTSAYSQFTLELQDAS